MKNLALLLFVLLTFAAAAQQKPLNTVYLKNGSIIKGDILEEKEGESVKIRTADHSVWVFKVEEVARIERTRIIKPADEVDPKLSPGVFTQLQVELMPSKKQSAEGTITALTGVVAYQVNPHFSAGVGTGVEAFHISMTPLFGDLRYYFRNDRFTPFINLKAGWAFPLENQRDAGRNMKLISKGGAMTGIEVGYLKSLSNSVRFSFTLGYRYQHLDQSGLMDQYIYQTFPAGSSTYKVDRKVSTDFNRIVVAIGFHFK